jgi:hypothetical protein
MAFSQAWQFQKTTLVVFFEMFPYSIVPLPVRLKENDNIAPPPELTVS